MTLSELLATNPDWPASLTDAQALAWLQESVPVVGAIGSRTLLRWGAAASRLARLRDAASNHASDAVRSLAEAALLTVSRPDTELDMGDPAHVALVDALVAGGVLTAADKSELLALATTQVPRWQQAGVPDYGDDASWMYWIGGARS